MSDSTRSRQQQPGAGAGRPRRAGWRLTSDDVTGLVATAARAPSVHNTQPWRFRVREHAVELRADPDRQLRRVDPDGREMLISCGAALYGLRLGMRRLGYRPDVEVLPDPGQPGLIARVRPAGYARMTRDERDLIAAVPHRHTHRGPFAPGRVPARLLAALAADAAAEGASLILVDRADQVAGLAELTAAASRAQRADPEIQAELRRWMRPSGSVARDGVPAHAWVGWPAAPGREPGAASAPGRRAPERPACDRLPQRDFGRPGELPAGGPLPSATAVLATTADSPADWVAAGQALDRLLLRAAAGWVFAGLQSQALESPRLRAEVGDRLCRGGVPQMLMQFGRANTAAATARRPAAEILGDARPAPGERP